MYFGSVIGELIDWKPHEDEKPIMRKGHKGMIFSIVTDSTRIFTISDDRTIRMWPIDDRESGPLCTVFGHTARPFAICVDPINYRIYTGGIEQTLFCWKYDERSIDLRQKIAIPIGVIQKISKIDDSTLAISSQNGDLLEIHVEQQSLKSKIVILKDDLMNFANLNGKLVILTADNELVLFESDAMLRIIFRCTNIKHMTSSDDSVVAWHQNTWIVITTSSVHRLKLSMNIISATCHASYVAIKTIDGIIHVYNFADVENIRCLKRFRAQNASMIPAVISVVHDNLLVIGTTHGELYHVDLDEPNDDIRLSLSRSTSFELFGGKEVTCIRSIPNSSIFMTLGKTGIWSTIRLIRGGTTNYEMEVMNFRSFSTSSRMAWPSKFIEWKGNLLIVGFYGTSLIIWNSTTNLPIFETYCGGGHRIWQLNGSEENKFNFDFIRDSQLCRQKIDFLSKNYWISNAHSSPIVAASGSSNYLVTVSLDGHLSISDGNLKRILTIFVGENLLCTDIYDEADENGTVYILTGGGKSKLSIIWFNSLEFKNSSVFSLRHVSRPDEGRVVAVKTCRIAQKTYFIASYSSGTIEVFGGISLESVFSIEIEDSLGIAAKMDYSKSQLVVGTSGSYILTYDLLEDGVLREKQRVKLPDRSGVTSISYIPEDDSTIIGCDSGHVYKYHTSTITKIHSHLSTVVGIVVTDRNRIHTVSLDCAVVTSSMSPSATSSRIPTIIGMPNGMVKTGESTLVVVGDGIQSIEC